jgi:uncharacterized protein involved in response to NO
MASFAVGRWPSLPLLSGGFRPFFLLAGAWAVLALALWVLMLNGQLLLPTRFDPIDWHIHAMLFGFVLASVGGFLLTALPNWTGRPPAGARHLAVLASLWLAGRIACLFSVLVPAWLAITIDLLFPLALFLLAAHEVVAARNWRNLAILAPLALFVVADLLMHLRAVGTDIPAGLGWRLGLICPLVLISAIAGRIVPAFTRNWLVLHGGGALPASRGWVDRAALGILHVGLLGWAFVPHHHIVGYPLLAAGGANAWRLARWRGAAVAREPLLLILHVGYAWLAIGAALLGLAVLLPAVPIAAAIHTLAVGAIATMILAVMTRATLGHTGRALTARPVTVGIYVLISMAAAARIAAAWAAALFMPLIIAAAICWISAFALFDVVYGRMLVTPALHGPAARGKGPGHNASDQAGESLAGTIQRTRAPRPPESLSSPAARRP